MKWRKEARYHDTRDFEPRYEPALAERYRQCADALERELRRREHGEQAVELRVL